MTDKNRFLNLEEFVATKRHTALALSPSGERLIAAVSELNEKGNAYVTSLWQLPTNSKNSPQHPVRLTRGKEGESFAGFTSDDDVLFTAKRKDTATSKPPAEDAKPENKGGDDERTRLLRLPRHGGEAYVVSRRRGGFSQLTPAKTGGRIFFLASSSPYALSSEEEETLAQARKDKKVTGILHAGYPVRSWDRDLGPGVSQLFFADPLDPADSEAELTTHRVSAIEPWQSLDNFAINSDGTFALAGLSANTHGYHQQSQLLGIDVNTGMSEIVLKIDGANIGHPVFAPGDRFVLFTKYDIPSASVPLATRIMILDRETGAVKQLAPKYADGSEFTDWPGKMHVVAKADADPANASIDEPGLSVLFTADHLGAGMIARLDLDTETIYNLTEDRCHYTFLNVDPHTGDAYALADAINQAPYPVYLAGAAAATSAVKVEKVATPVAEVDVPGTLTEVFTTAEDGTELRSWLCLPEGVSADDPVPFLLWVHGGPFGSWNGWTWRWNPWTATARGYAVLLPDPAISTGYGQHMLDRGWGQLGGTPFDDLMRMTKAALERPEIDETRKAAMGGSYGGYMANWIAGHTGDFFNCIVTHAGLYALDQFRANTDTAYFWAENLTDEHNEKYNPQSFVENITQPMLVIHGDKDYRVPISEGMRLWFDLLRTTDVSPEELPHRFLYFPDENHWILKPGNSQLWYETVYAFLAQHVLGEEFVRPQNLG